MTERVALIGAGPSGMALLRALALAEDEGAVVPEVVAFERQADWGGQWNLDWRTAADRFGEPVHSAMYRDLWINGPKECMEYPDYSFDAHFGRPVSSYLPQEAMKDYILGRVAHVAERIRPLIRFGTVVRWVQPLDDGTFEVTSVDLTTGAARTEAFDRIVVATGHFHAAHTPSWPGVEDFPGLVQHAHDYRTPEPFAGRRVLVIGSSYSGQDLALQLHRGGAAHVTTAYRKAPQELDWPAGMDERPEVQGFAGSRVAFADGSSAEYDAVLLCTGYRHHYPFLPAELALSGPNLPFVPSLWKSVVWQADPRVLYLGATQQWFTLTLLDAQAFFARDVLLGRAPVPSAQERQADIDAWTARMAAIDSTPVALAFQADQIRDLTAGTGYPEMDLDGVIATFLQMGEDKRESLTRYRDRTHRSLVTGTRAAAHPVPWMHHPDGSLEGYLAHFPG
ncbi:NAD(P)/FAD-dependent oxidoreductase [Micrococcus porci]|uniref:NAD(P)-binding domain-containing protein n=1 Tax=Micrococcus porci TaxID=2856555 RepID=UPI001CCBFEFD|nr:NAD(P)/FAD-dependent oxidoreductase [Micrococcus porci]UBH25351.1 NAD(P)/FAD-dependent oxidoreductase [Micrococcus porci]